MVTLRVLSLRTDLRFLFLVVMPSPRAMSPSLRDDELLIVLGGREIAIGPSTRRFNTGAYMCSLIVTSAVGNRKAHG